MKKFLMIAMMMVLVAPSTALAGKKKATSSNKDLPTESLKFDYTQPVWNYTAQQKSNPKQKSNISSGSMNKGGARH